MDPKKSYCVVDFNFYRGIDDVMVVKEMAVFAPNEHMHQMWVFEAPYLESEIPAPSRTYNNKNLKPLLQIKWEDGDVLYHKFPTILANATIRYDEIYVFGKEKCNFVSDTLMREVFNLSPMINEFERMQKQYKCDLHYLRGEHRCKNHSPADKCPIAARDRYGLFPSCMRHKTKQRHWCVVVNCDRIAFPLLAYKNNCAMSDPLGYNIAKANTTNLYAGFQSFAHSPYPKLDTDVTFPPPPTEKEETKCFFDKCHVQNPEICHHDADWNCVVWEDEGDDGGKLARRLAQERALVQYRLDLLKSPSCSHGSERSGRTKTYPSGSIADVQCPDPGAKIHSVCPENYKLQDQTLCIRSSRGKIPKDAGERGSGTLSQDHPWNAPVDIPGSRTRVDSSCGNKEEEEEERESVKMGDDKKTADEKQEVGQSQSESEPKRLYCCSLI
jgi:hypothetical protein